MKINVKKIAIVGGSLAVLVYLVGAYAWGGKRGLSKALGKKIKPKEAVKPKGVKPPKRGGGGKGGGHFTQTFPDTVPMPTQQGHTTEGNNQSGGKVPIQVVIPNVDNSNNVNL